MATRKPYRKVPETKSVYDGLEPWEMEHAQAREAIARGKPEPVGQYLREVTDILRVVADRLDPGEGMGPRLDFTPKPKPRADESEWNSEHSDVKQAIARGAARPVGWYLRDVALALSRLANTLDPTSGNKAEYRVQFVRTSKGRSKGGTTKMLDDNRLRMDVLSERGYRRGEKEAAVMGVMQKRKASRATVYRRSRRKK